jgi:hypothetical protein
MIIPAPRTLLLLLTLAACGDPPADAGTSGDSSSTEAQTDASTSSDSSSTGDGSSTGSSTSGESSTSTGDSSGSTEASSGADACFGDPCTGACGPGMYCAPHPDNAGLTVCASPCAGPVGLPCTVEVDECGDLPLGECRAIIGASVLCFPVLCPNGPAECADGECVDGRCV